MKAQLCALALDPFYCHANAVDNKTPEGNESLCIGWVEVVDAMNKRGDYEHLTDEKRAMLRAGIQMVVKLEEQIEAGQDIDDFDVLKELSAVYAAVYEASA